jgi:hypothetical protein
MQALVDRITSTLDWITTHPLLFMIGFSVGVYLFWIALKASFASSGGLASSRVLGAGAGGLVSRGGYAPIPGTKRE